MNNYFEIGILLAVIALAISYDIFLKPVLENIKNKNGTPLLDTEVLNLIDYACKRGVESAEQLCNTGAITKENRNAEALNFTFDVIKKAGFVPLEYLDITKRIIEAHVRKL